MQDKLVAGFYIVVLVACLSICYMLYSDFTRFFLVSVHSTCVGEACVCDRR
jgi:hypothetical protein